MADIQPLRGLRFNSEVQANFAQVITPPYDVISEEAQAKYYARNQNIMLATHITLFVSNWEWMNQVIHL